MATTADDLRQCRHDLERWKIDAEEKKREAEELGTPTGARQCWQMGSYPLVTPGKWSRKTFAPRGRGFEPERHPTGGGKHH